MDSGSPGAFGAPMDEYARAATEFRIVVAGFTPEAFAAARESEDPDTRSATCSGTVAGWRGGDGIETSREPGDAAVKHDPT